MIHDPVQSSFPPSRVYKVIQQNHGAEKADEYLRRAREALFAFNQNIGEESIMIEIVNNIGLDGKAIIKEAENENGHALLEEDFQRSASLGARGFPSIIMVNEENKGVKVVGSRPMDSYVSALSQILVGEDLKPTKQPSLLNLLEKEKLLFAKEIEVMYDVENTELQAFVEKNLAPGTYEEKELLGEKYLVNK